MSMPYVPTAMQCEAMRCSSAMITRMVCDVRADLDL